MNRIWLGFDMWTLAVDRELRLRQVLPEFAEEIFDAVKSDQERLATFLLWAGKGFSLDSTRSFAENAAAEAGHGKSMHASILRKNRVIGALGFNTINMLEDNAEIGYWIVGEEEGKGTVTKCTEALIEYGFSELGLHRIVIRCATENSRSKAIPKRLGFKSEGVMREAGKLRRGYVDLEVFSLLKHEHVQT